MFNYKKSMRLIINKLIKIVLNIPKFIKAVLIKLPRPQS